MKVILQQDIKKLGNKGDIVEVSEGYGRNFLLPRKAAVLATAENLNVAKAKKASKDRKDAMAADEAKLMAKQLQSVEVTIPVKIGEGGKLFGSVTGKDVSLALKEKNIDIDKKKIAIKGDVTGQGVYEAVIKVHPTITSTIKVNVIAK
ncbi:50S ribosomal protein L9 [Selenomonas sp.]|uniref:50S ribosomal protein L9 n=1 Tax=Selenomonas sp. TaxID=2053611 RepID=UPI002A7F0AC0|nr:50S ribosomal protein L9 [Selenomonas sp.]MDY4417397.1 50S ribosomal protein L9 [Selenomonas sp.]